MLAWEQHCFAFPNRPGHLETGGGGCSLLGLLNRQLQGEGQPSDHDEPSKDLWCMPEAERKDPNWVPN